MKKIVKVALAAGSIAVVLILGGIILIASWDVSGSKVDYNLSDYGMNIIELSDSTVKPEDFSELGDFTLNSEKMNPSGYGFYNVYELPDCMRKYYFDNTFYLSENEAEDCYCYFCGKDAENVRFGYFIEKDFQRATWYISNGYQIQNAYDNEISEILITENSDEKVIQTPTDLGRFPRIKSAEAVKITEAEAIDKCAEQFNKSGYEYFDRQEMQYERDTEYDFLKKLFDCNPSEEYLVLAKFDDSGIYQLLGVIGREVTVPDSLLRCPDISEDFTCEQFIKYYYDMENISADEIDPNTVCAHYYEVYYGFSPGTLDFAASTSGSGDFEYTVYSNGKAVIDRYCGDASEIVFPNRIDGHEVAGIACKIDFDTDLKKVTVQEGIEFIGPGVFYGHSKLKNVTLPESLRFIYWAAFCDCKSLKNINVPNGIEYVYQNAFGGCKKGIEEKFPEDVIFFD